MALVFDERSVNSSFVEMVWTRGLRQRHNGGIGNTASSGPNGTTNPTDQKEMIDLWDGHADSSSVVAMRTASACQPFVPSRTGSRR